MKKQLALFAAALAILALASCPSPVDGGEEPEPSQVEKTTVVFDNTQGVCTAAVYSDYRRREEDKIAEIPSGKSSEEIKWTAGDSHPFYFTYFITLNGVKDLTIPFIPEIGRDQIAVRIDAEVKNTIPVPLLAETLSSSDALLSRDSYLIIKNASSYPFRLYKNQNVSVKPENAGSDVVNAKETALYKISPGSSAPYSLLVGAEYQPFPGAVSGFEAGHVYCFDFTRGSIGLNYDLEVNLVNMLPPGTPIPGMPETPGTSGLPGPGAPVVTAGAGSLTVSWDAVDGADQYEVWYGIGAADTLFAVVNTTTATITGLDSGTVYTVRIRARNAAGAGGWSGGEAGGEPQPETPEPEPPQTPGGPQTPGTPPVTPVLSPGLYKGAAIETAVYIGAQNLAQSLPYIKSIGASGDKFYIVLEADETIGPQTLDASVNAALRNTTITLMGQGGERTITLNANGAMFTLSGYNESNQFTFVLDANVKLRGRIYNNSAVVKVNQYAEFVMHGGEISGNTNYGSSPSGGGVYVNNGTFTMSGGTISGNTASSPNSWGGGVFVNGNTFTKSGNSIIYGLDAIDPANKNVATYGRAVFYNDYTPGGRKARNATAYPVDTMDSRLSGVAGGWE